jgi:Domain of unknown function (DUF4390)
VNCARLKRQFSRNFFVAIFLFSLSTGISYAEKFGAEIKKAELTLQGDSYVLSAELDYQLSKRALNALLNGVPLFWNLKIIIRQKRNYLWDKTLVEKTIRYRIQYHALLNMYRVRNEDTGLVENFSTLSPALALISIPSNFRLLDKEKVDPQKTFYAQMKIIFDREALPLPLRPIAYLNPQWHLSSNWYIWSLTK